jgi:hypothetical protein
VLLLAKAIVSCCGRSASSIRRELNKARGVCSVRVRVVTLQVGFSELASWLVHIGWLSVLTPIAFLVLSTTSFSYIDSTIWALLSTIICTRTERAVSSNVNRAAIHDR